MCHAGVSHTGSSWLTPLWTITCVSLYAVGRQPAQHRRRVELERLRCRGHGSRARLQPCSRPLGRWTGDHQGHDEPGALSSVRRILQSLPWLPSICHLEWYLPNRPCSQAVRLVNRLRRRPGGVVRQEVGGRALSGEGGWASASVLGWHEVILPFWPCAGLPLLGGRF